jgi:hypothetical protein
MIKVTMMVKSVPRIEIHLITFGASLVLGTPHSYGTPGRTD